MKKSWQVAHTDSNHESSRSHALVTITLERGDGSKTELVVVDLAGSERLSSSKASGERKKETQAINKSLSSLGDCICALANGDAHVPYRNSRLTHYLQPYLGGEAKTLMFVNLSPADYNAEESHSSLLYAERVKKVKNSSAKTVETQEIKALKDQLAKLKKLQAGKKKG